MNQPICVECRYHNSTPSGDRCLHRDLMRKPAINPVTGNSGFRTESGDFSLNEPLPDCHTYNTLQTPCQLFEGKESGNGEED